MRRRLGLLVALFLVLSLGANVFLLIDANRWRGVSAEALARAGRAEATAAALEADQVRGQATASALARRVAGLEAEVRTLQTAVAAATPAARVAPTPTPTPGLDAETRLEMDVIERQVVELRGLSPNAEVERVLWGKEALRTYVTDELLTNFTPAEARNDALLYAAFDLMEPDLDLRSLFVDLYSEQIAGFYDSEKDKLFVIGGAFGPLEKITFAHEYTHFLQDQHYDLEALGLNDENENDEQVLALQALVEGDATALMLEYAQVGLTYTELVEVATASVGPGQEVLARAPAVIQHELLFPYREGFAFVLALRGNPGGWAEVDRAFAAPPTSTEHILHPDRYLAGDEPLAVTLPDLAAPAGAWTLAESNTWGEFRLREHLGLHLPEDQVDAAATGWGGDRYALYRDEAAGQTLLLFRLRWDTPADAAEFAEQYGQWAAAAYDTALDAGWWERPGAVLHFDGASDESLIVVGPDRAAVEAVLGLVE